MAEVYSFSYKNRSLKILGEYNAVRKTPVSVTMLKIWLTQEI